MKTTIVIYHRADFDGLFCREIARKFIPDAELIGWDYGDPLIPWPKDGTVYILDLSPSCLDATTEPAFWRERMVWIDHHKSAIETQPKDIPGYRIDGVAACRLAWQWFTRPAIDDGASPRLPSRQDFIDRKVSEPWAVRLAGEYDIWDKRDSDAELFQHGLRSEELFPVTWDCLLSTFPEEDAVVTRLLNQGRALQFARTKENESIIKDIGFTFKWEGLTWLACNAARYNSHLFTAGLRPDHDACFGFKFTGKPDGEWSVSLYHAPGKEHHDLSLIAKKYGGGGHRGACGFKINHLPFLV